MGRFCPTVLLQGIGGLLAVIAINLAGSGVATAGEWTVGKTAFCDWVFSGPVQPGDAQKLAAIPAAAAGASLCLNSTEGDMTEGLRILRVLRDRNLRTRLLPGQRCEGACALLFLGGSTSDGPGLVRFPHRELWAGGRLGFSLASQGAETTLAVAERLFSIKVTEEQGHRLLEDHLFLQTLRAGDRPYTIDTVGDAYLSNIPVMGIAAPDPAGPAHITHICDAVYLRHRLHDGTAGPLDADFLSAAHSIANLRGHRMAPIQAAVAETKDGVTGYAGPYWAGSKYWRRECYVAINRADVAAYGGENAALGITGIAVEFRDYGGAPRDMAAFEAEAWAAATRLVGAYDVPPILMYPFNTRLDDLPSNDQAALARAVGGPALPPPVPGFARYDGVDLAGGDLSRHKTPDGAACLAACQAQPTCTAATHDRWNGLCVLKDVTKSTAALAQQPKSDVYVAGPWIDKLRQAKTTPVILRRPGKGFFDRPVFYFQGQDFDDCATQCLSETRCAGFNYIAETGACPVYDRPGAYFDRAGTVAGLKMQPL